MNVWDMMKSVSDYKPKFNSFFKNVNSDFIDEREKKDPPLVGRLKLDGYEYKVLPNGEWERVNKSDVDELIPTTYHFHVKVRDQYVTIRPNGETVDEYVEDIVEPETMLRSKMQRELQVDSHWNKAVYWYPE